MGDRDFAQLRQVKPPSQSSDIGASEQLTIRLDAAVIDAFRSSGDGWQTRMNDALTEWLKTHSLPTDH